MLLDAGGTLIAERSSRAALYAQAAREAGLEVDEPGMRLWMDRTLAGLAPRERGHFRYTLGWFSVFIERLFVDGLGLERGRLAALQESLFARFSDPGTFRVVPGAAGLLEALAARDLRAGVVSNWSPALPGLLEGLGLAGRLDFVVVSALEGCEKPGAEIFRRALARAGVSADAALHAGDDPERDVQGARAAGILPVLVGPPLGRPGEDRDCVRVEDLFALRRFIEAGRA